MRVDHSHRRVEAGIGDAPLPRLAVVVGDVLHQPVDRVVGVAAFVDVFRAVLYGHVRTHVDELALRTHASANILVGEDEQVFGELTRRPDAGLVGIHAIGPHAVGSAEEHDRVRLRDVLGSVHGCEEPHAIPHRDHVLVLGVVRLDPYGVLLGGLFVRRDRGRLDDGATDDEKQQPADTHEHNPRFLVDGAVPCADIVTQPALCHVCLEHQRVSNSNLI